MRPLYYTKTDYCSNSELTRIKNLISGKTMPDPENAYRFGRLFDAMVTDTSQIDYEECSQHEIDTAKRMTDSFMMDSFCAMVHKNFEKQKEIYLDALQFEYDGIDFTLPFKGRFDFYRKPTFVIDLKSTECTSQKQFEAACKHFDYDRQGAVYLKISGAEKFMLIGVSKIKPYKVFKVAIEIGDGMWKSGTEKMNFLAFLKWIL